MDGMSFVEFNDKRYAYLRLEETSKISATPHTGTPPAKRKIIQQNPFSL